MTGTRTYPYHCGECGRGLDRWYYCGHMPLCCHCMGTIHPPATEVHRRRLVAAGALPPQPWDPVTAQPHTAPWHPEAVVAFANFRQWAAEFRQRRRDLYDQDSTAVPVSSGTDTTEEQE